MEDLPLELLFVICEYLPTRDKISLSCVSSHFKRMMNNPFLNRYISFKNTWDASSFTILKYISKHRVDITHLDLQNCYWLKASDLGKSLLKLTNLQFLDTRECGLAIEDLVKILTKNKELKHLGWSVDKKTMTVFAEEPENSVQKAQELHNTVNVAFNQLLSLRLNFFMGTKECFQDTHSLSRILSVFLHELELSYIEIVWPDYSSETGISTMHEAKNIVIQTQKGKKTKLFSFNPTVLNTATDVPTAFQQGRVWFFHWNLFTPNINSDCSIWIFPLHKSHINLLSTHRGNYIFQGEEQSLAAVDIANCVLIGEKFYLEEEKDEWRQVHTGIPKSLKYLNVASTGVDGTFFGDCHFPNLLSLNLQGSPSSLCPDLQSFETIIGNAPCLKHLNLNSLDIHEACTDFSTDELLQVLAISRTLVSLSLPSCAMVSQCEGKKPEGEPKEEGPQCAANASDQSAHECTSFPFVVESCPLMEEFELIHDHFYSVLGVIEPMNFHSSEGICKVCKTCSCAINDTLLQPIADWTYLRKLTLAGLKLKGNAEFLVTIAKQCTGLEFLSLAHLMPTLGHSSGVTNLQKALLHCHKLKDFRLEQAYFNITSQFLSSMHQSKNLERVCLIARNGRLAKQALVPWLDNCRKLIFLQLFCDGSKKDCKEIKKALMSRYGNCRPGFHVGVFDYAAPFNGGNKFDPELSTATPTVHLNEVTLFGSRVATNWRVAIDYKHEKHF